MVIPGNTIMFLVYVNKIDLKIHIIRYSSVLLNILELKITVKQ